MKSDQWYLCKIAEECTEVAQRALKAQQFGLGEVQKGQPHNNMDRLKLEFHDLIVTFAEFANNAGENPNIIFPSAGYHDNRVAKMRKYLELSISLNQVDETTSI